MLLAAPEHWWPAAAPFVSSSAGSLPSKSAVALAIMSLRPPSGLNQPMRRQNAFDRRWRFSAGGPAIRARSSAISSAVKSRP